MLALRYMKNRELQHLAKRLAHLAQMMSVNAETAEEVDQFYRLLDQVMDLSPTEETIVQGMALSGLGELDDNNSVRWLAEELEVEAALQHLPNDRGHERSCLLFALPVVIPGTDSVNTHADHELLGELHEILEEADVIDQAASFGLVSRLFSYTELFSKSYGELRKLNRFLGAQVLQGEKVLMLPDGDFDVGEELDGASCTPGVDLFFVVGMAVTRPSELENVFPPLVNDPQDEKAGGFEKEQGYQMTEEGGAMPYDIAKSGLTADGNAWEYAFCVAFDNAFGAIEGSMTVLPPDGIAEDLRRGLELAREIGTCQMFERNFEGPHQRRWARLSFLQESEGEVWFDVHCQAAPEVEPLETMRWPVLNHESEEETLEKLMECLQDAGIEQENPPAANHPLGSMLLH